MVTVCLELCTSNISSCHHHLHHPASKNPQWKHLVPVNPGPPGKWPIKWRQTPRRYLFGRPLESRLNLKQSVETTLVGLASKLKLFWLVPLLHWPFTFRPLNGVTHHRSHGLPSCCQFPACYGLPTLCGIRGCKNKAALIPGRMSYKATKPGSVYPVS